MGKFVDLTGQKFGRWTVIEKAQTSSTGHIKWHCKCECGAEREVASYSLLEHKSISCGCFRIEQTKKTNTKHGDSYSRLHKIWSGIKKRCYNKQSPCYKNYGGRGIIMCDEWRNNYNSFMEWSLNNGYSNELTIDRIDNNGDYEPLNCRWVAMKEQANNKRSNKNITAFGKTLTAAQWSEKVGIKRNTIVYRINHGWDVESALTVSPNFNNTWDKISKGDNNIENLYNT